MFWGQLKNDRNKEPVQCFCAGSCFDVPMCGAGNFVYRTEKCKMARGAWCAPGHFHKRIQVFLTSERKPCSQAYACVARKRM